MLIISVQLSGMKKKRESEWTCRDALNTSDREWNSTGERQNERRKRKETDTYVDEQIRLES